MDSAPVRLAHNSRSTGFPQAAVNVFTYAASYPYIRRFCSLFPFLVESAGSLARQVFLCTLPVERHRRLQALRRGCRISARSAELRILLMKGAFGSGTYVRRAGAFGGTKALPRADRAPRSLRPRA